ncbi:MAG: hypothetical protein SGARI_007553 [Bacillariaceae sp.]
MTEYEYIADAQRLQAKVYSELGIPVTETELKKWAEDATGSYDDYRRDINDKWTKALIANQQQNSNQLVVNGILDGVTRNGIVAAMKYRILCTNADERSQKPN